MRIDATVTIVGRAATNPQVSQTSNGDRVTFRVVSTERRFDEGTGEWVDGDEFGVGVVCWRQQAKAVLTTVRRGDPIVVIGRISTRRFERNGQTDYFTDVKGDFVGLDVGRMGSRFVRAAAPERATTGSTAAEPGEVTSGADVTSRADPRDAAGWTGEASRPEPALSPA